MAKCGFQVKSICNYAMYNCVQSLHVSMGIQVRICIYGSMIRSYLCVFSRCFRIGPGLVFSDKAWRVGLGPSVALMAFGGKGFPHFGAFKY